MKKVIFQSPRSNSWDHNSIWHAFSTNSANLTNKIIKTQVNKKFYNKQTNNWFTYIAITCAENTNLQHCPSQAKQFKY